MANDQTSVTEKYREGSDSEDRSSCANNVLKEEQQTHSRQVQRSLESGKQTESSIISYEESDTNKSSKDETES